MKKLRFIFGMLVCTALFTACSSDDEKGGNGDDPIDGDAYLTVEEADVPLTCDAKNLLIDVSTNLKTLEVNTEMQDQADAMWLNVKYSAKNKQLKVNVDENRIKENGERKATIKLSGKGVEDVLITLTQAPSEKEHDPYEVDIEGDWNDLWVVDCYLHGNKYDPILWDNGNVTPVNPPTASWWQAAVGDKITVALKLETDFLAKCAGKKLTKIELNSTMNPAVSVKFAIAKSEAAVPNDGTFPDYISETYAPSTELWSSNSSDVKQGTNGWFESACPYTFPADISGNIFVVATITGGGEWYTNGDNSVGEFQWTRQVLNKHTPTYVNLGNLEDGKLYKFIGGTTQMNIHFETLE